MHLRERARHFAAVARRALSGPPLSRLIRLLRRGETAGREYVDLCLQLGLAKRAAAALRPEYAHNPSQPVRLAALLGQVDEAVSLAHDLVVRGTGPAVSRREFDAIVSCVAPLAPETALAAIAATGRPSAAEPALRLRLGDIETARQLLDKRGAQLGPQRWLLWANLQQLPAWQVEGLNRFLAAYGLANVRLRDPMRPLAIGNLGGHEHAAACNSRDAALLSVVMTCFDCVAYVEAAIRAVLQQTHRHLELIVVDDASRDDTWRCLQAAAAADPRVRAVRLRCNVGTYAAKNVGLALARGEFLAFQDADDWSCPERFALCLAALQLRPWLQAVTCEYVRLQDDGRFWSPLCWPLQRRTPNSVLFRRRVLERIGFFDEHRFGSDSEYVARLEVALGPRSMRRLTLPLILAARRSDSLMSVPATGLNACGRSQVRAEFQEAWTEALLQSALAGTSLHLVARRGTTELIAETAGIES